MSAEVSIDFPRLSNKVYVNIKGRSKEFVERLAKKIESIAKVVVIDVEENCITFDRLVTFRENEFVTDVHTSLNALVK